MGFVRTRMDKGGQLVLAISLVAASFGLAALPTGASAQLFDGTPMLRPPIDVPSVPPGPAHSIAPPNPSSAAPAAPKGPMLQSLPPNPGQVHAVPNLPAGQGALALSARFGRDLPAINGGLHWRIFRTEQNGMPRVVKEDKGSTPTFVLPPGAYVVSVAFGLASATKAVSLRAETVKDVLEIPAGGLRIEGRVGDVRIPHGQIAFELYKGSQFEPGDKRPIATAITTGDVILVNPRFNWACSSCAFAETTAA